MVAKIFIDGEAGTTGLQIRDRLTGRRDLEIVSISPAQRKDLRARKDLLNSADLVILCLPDDAAREAIELIESPDVRIIDASSAHRTATGWTYGLPEIAPGQRQAVAGARRVSNPGCWPTGFIALVRPLVAAGLIPPDWPLSVHGVSGYSGGGKPMIAEFEDKTAANATDVPFRLYGLGMNHKHLPEMQVYAGLDSAPVFSPAVGRFRQGMIVEVPLPIAVLPGRPKLSDLQHHLATAYAGESFIQVAQDDLQTVAPQMHNGTNIMSLRVFGSDTAGQARLVAVLDNLGKGAGGAAVQNLNLMLGLPEAEGL